MQAQNDPLIFIVDDNFVYNKLIATHLKRNKFQRIECFLSGEECMNNLSKKPDIVIQDYHMDGMSGIEVLKESKKRNPTTEFIFLSGDDSYEIAANTIKYGAYDYLVKDRLAFKKLVEKIRKIQSVKLKNSKNKVGFSSLFKVIIILATRMIGGLFSPDTWINNRNITPSIKKTD